MDLQRLRCFVAVAEDLHFTRAAQRLFLAQPALSVAVRKLERELGVDLFVRSTRRVELTEAAEALLPRARHLLAAERALLDAAREQRLQQGTAPGARLRIGSCVPEFAGALTAPILEAYRSAAGGGSQVVILPFGAEHEAVTSGRVDVVVCTQPPDPRVEDDVLFTYERALMLRPGSPLQRADRLTLEDIVNEPLLYNRDLPAEWMSFYLCGHLRDLSDQHLVHVDGDNPSAVIGAVLSGTGSAPTDMEFATATSAVTLVPLTGVDPVPVVLRTRPACDDPRVAVLRQAARRVVDDLLPLVPHAHPWSA